MKHLILLTVLSLALVACGGKKAEQAKGKDIAAVSSDVKSFELDNLLKKVDGEIDQTVKVVGYVTHTCKHSGKRCFIVGDSQKVSMRIEAKGEIGGFNRELVGSKIEVTGVLKERRLTKEYIDKAEEEVKQQEDGSAESCAAELNNINEMRKWMKDNNKDYYAIYYMDGMSYVTLE